jgi:hypothetical protein
VAYATLFINFWEIWEQRARILDFGFRSARLRRILDFRITKLEWRLIQNRKSKIKWGITFDHTSYFYGHARFCRASFEGFDFTRP